MSCEKVNDKPGNLNDQEIRICDALYKKFNSIKNIDKNTKNLILNGIKNLLFSKKNVKIS